MDQETDKTHPASFNAVWVQAAELNTILILKEAHPTQVNTVTLGFSGQAKIQLPFLHYLLPDISGIRRVEHVLL